MRNQRTSPTRWVSGAVLALAVAMTAACGDKATAESQEGTTASFDQSLQDRLPSEILDSGVIVVGTDASYPPMASFAPDGRTIVGMEPDLAELLGEVLGVDVEFKQTDFTKLIPRVRNGKLDIAISAITDTEERAEKADFVNYLSAGTVIVVRRGNPLAVSDLKDLCGKVVAVEIGTIQVDLLDRAQTNCTAGRIDVRTFPTNSDALLELRTGRAAAVLNDLGPARFLVDDTRTKAQYQLASTTQYEPGLYGVVVAKDKPGLRDAVRGALEQLVSTGAYAAVLEEWRLETGAVERITVNSER